MKWFEDPAFLSATREKLGMTQLRLAERAGVKRSQVANLEAGRTPMTLANTKRLWGALAAVEVELKSRVLVPLSSLAGGEVQVEAANDK